MRKTRTYKSLVADGFEIRVGCGEQVRLIGPDGEVSNASHKDLWLEVTVKPTTMAFGVKQKSWKDDGDTKVSIELIEFMKKISIDERPALGRQSLFTQRDGRLVNNDIRVTFLESDGTVTYVQISLVRQEEKTWVVVQEKGHGQFYKKSPDSPASCEGIRPELANALAPKLGKWRLPTSVSFETPITPQVPKDHWLVEWFDEARGVGAVNQDTGDGSQRTARVHWKQCPMQDGGRRYLQANQIIRVKEVVPIKGEGTSFSHEVRGVHLYKAIVNPVLAPAMARQLDKLALA